MKGRLIGAGLSLIAAAKADRLPESFLVFPGSKMHISRHQNLWKSSAAA